MRLLTAILDVIERAIGFLFERLVLLVARILGRGRYRR